MEIGFAVCGSFCTFSQVFPAMEAVAQSHHVYPIFSDAAYRTDTRFGNAAQHVALAERICGEQVLHTIEQVEPVGPKKLLELLIVAPCTGNTLAKIAHGIADGPVTMAVKSHLRNARPVLLALSTNDALSVAAENIGILLARKHIYFVPFGQDDPLHKPTSMLADLHLLLPAAEAAVAGKQLQPILLPPRK